MEQEVQTETKPEGYLDLTPKVSTPEVSTPEVIPQQAKVVEKVVEETKVVDPKPKEQVVETIKPKTKFKDLSWGVKIPLTISWIVGLVIFFLIGFAIRRFVLV